MGNNLVQFYKEKVKTTWKIAFYSVIIIGFLVHLYKFTNYLPGRDSLMNLYSDQNVVGSGRWFLSIACGISSYFDLPMTIGILSILYIAITAIVLTELFHIENPVLIVLASGILVTFPGVTETFLYEYTADGYMLAMLLAAIAVYITRLCETVGWKQYLLGGTLLCLSCAIYQSYISFALILVLLHFLYELLENRCETKAMVFWALKQILMYAAAMAAYYVIWKLCLKVQDVGMADYQGISEIGTDLIGTFLGGFGISVRSVILYFFHWNFLNFGFTVYSFLNILFLILATFILLLAPIRAGVFSRKLHLLLYVVCWVLFIPCNCIWAFASNSILFRPMMLPGMALLYIFVLILFERWTKPRCSNVAALLLAVIIFNFGLMANIFYSYLFESYEQSYARGFRLMMDIEQLSEEQDFSTVAIVGDSHYEDKLETYDEENQKQTPAAGIDVIGKYMYENLLFNNLSASNFMKHFLGMDLEILPEWEVHHFMQTEQFREMSVWPDEGSMMVDDGVLYIKIQNAN